MRRIVLIASLVFMGCTPIYKISTSENQGIPFYTQQLIKHTEYNYKVKYYEIQVTFTYEEKRKTSNNEADKRKFSTTLIKYAYPKCAIRLNNIFSSQSSPIDAKREVESTMENGSPGSKSECILYDSEQLNGLDSKEMLEKLSQTNKKQNSNPPKECEKKSNQVLAFVSESTSYKLELEDTPRYVNIRKPFLGSVEGTITLNENGTLASATTSITDETVGKVLDLIPFSDIITSKLELEDSTEDAEEMALTDEPILVNAKLSLIPITTMYTITKAFQKTDKEWVPKYTNYKVSRATSKGSTAEEEQKNIITMEGKLMLPDTKTEDKKEK
nr:MULTISPECIES: hypothetical protein [unclassified Allomuricauda]